MRVVYDTSVLATKVSRRDLIIQLQSDVSNGNIALVTSPFILNELERVLATKFGPDEARSKITSTPPGSGGRSRTAEGIEQISRDAHDDPIVATAITGQAEYIVTLDDDLLVLERYESVSIVTPGVFKEVLSKRERSH